MNLPVPCAVPTVFPRAGDAPDATGTFPDSPEMLSDSESGHYSIRCNNNVNRRFKCRDFVAFVLIFIALVFYSVIISQSLSGYGADKLRELIFTSVTGAPYSAAPAEGGRAVGYPEVSRPGASLSPYMTRRGVSDIKTAEAEEAPGGVGVVPVPEADDGGELPGLYYPIVAADLSTDAPLGLALHNETSFSPDLEALASEFIAVPSPSVLIIHTHGTEAFSDGGCYSEDESFRTEDTSRNVVAVGAALAAALRSRGIKVRHDETMYDAASYGEAYTRAAAAIRVHLAADPGINYVFDVHRDSVIASDLTKLRPAADVNGESCAQYMAVVGTDENGAAHPGWETNLSLAAAIQTEIAAEYPRVTRAINLRKSAFNEQYTSGSLLLEIGACGNTLDEALRTAKLVGDKIADVILPTR